MLGGACIAMIKAGSIFALKEFVTGAGRPGKKLLEGVTAVATSRAK